MSHYTIDYSNLSEAEKQKKAIQDIIDYIGQERFDIITVEAKKAYHAGMTEDEWRMQLTFAGIQGYPVTAWYKVLAE